MKSFLGRKIRLLIHCLHSLIKVGKKFDHESCYIPWWFIFWRGKQKKKPKLLDFGGLRCMVCDQWQDSRAHVKLRERRFRLDIRKKFFPQKVAERWNRLPREMVIAPAWQSWRHVLAILSGTSVLKARIWMQWSWWVPSNSLHSMTVILSLMTESLTNILLAPCSAFWYFFELSVFSSTLHLPPLYCCHQHLHSMPENLYSTKIIVL